MSTPTPTPKAPSVTSVSPLSLEAGSEAFATLSVDSKRRTDHDLALLAFRSSGSDGAFASAVSIAAATHGEAHLKATFVPTTDVPTWDEHISQAAARSPYAISEGGIRNLRNAIRILNAAGLPTDDALTFADAKRSAPLYTTAAKAQGFGSRLAIDGEPAKALRAAVTSRSVAKGSADAKRSADAKESAADRKADPIGFAFEALRKACGEDADLIDRLGDRASAFAAECHAAAKARRAAPDTVTTDGAPIPTPKAVPAKAAALIG